MRKFFDLFRQRTFRKMLLPWLTLLVVVIVLFSGIYFRLQYRSAYEKWKGQTDQSTQVCADFFHMWRTRVENIALVIQFNQPVIYSGAARDISTQALYDYEYMGFLNLMQTSCDILDSIWVWDEAGGYVYTSARSRYDASAAQFKGLLEERADGAWLTPRVIRKNINNAASVSSICATYTANLWQKGQPGSSTVYMNVDIASFYARLQEAAGLDRLLILDQDGRIALCEKPELLGAVYTPQAEKELGLDQAQFFISSVSSNNYTVMGALSARRSHLEINLQFAYLLIIVFAFLSITLLLCGVISRHIYNPLEPLIRSYDENANGKNELVKKSLEELAEQVQSERLRETPKDEMEPVRALMQDQLTPHMLGKLDVTGFQYVIITMQIDEPQRNMEKCSRLMPYFEPLIRSFLRNIMGNDRHTYSIYVNSGLAAAIVCLKQEDWRAAVEEIMTSLQEMLYAVSPCTVSMASSALHLGKEELSAAMTEALQALRRKIHATPGCHMFYEKMGEPSPGIAFPQSEMRKMLTALEQEDEQVLKSQYRQFVSLVNTSSMDADDMMMVYNQLLSQIIQVQMRRGIARSLIFQEPESSPYKYLSSLEFADHIADWLEEKLLLLWQQSAMKPAAGNVYINAFQKYMGEHYMEELLPENVAQAIGISYSYLRKLLSTEMNTTFSSYLLNLRLMYTKELLLTSHMVQKEIAEHVGFGSEQTLYRVFKQNEGCSPGEWRKEHGAYVYQQTMKKETGGDTNG